MKFTDKDLNRLLDGELDPKTEAQLRTEIGQNEQLASHFASLAMADLKFKESVNAIDDKTIPQDILDLLSEPAKQQNEHGRSPSRPWVARLAQIVTAPQSNWVPIVTSVTMLAIGIALTIHMLRPTTTSVFTDYQDAVRYGVMSFNHPVAQILSNTPSGSPQVLPHYSDLSVTPVLSFASTAGDYCREYTVTYEKSSHRAVACHQKTGWRVVLSMEGGQAIGQNEYQTASAITPSSFESKINSLINGDPMSYQHELRLIASNWKKQATDFTRKTED